MSIARAFTTKRTKRDADIPQRSLTTKQLGTGGNSSIRDKISSPVGLISTTNMLSYNAPDIYPTSSPSRSSNSASDTSDEDHKSISSASTPPSSPDTDKGTPEPNHLSCYFNAQSTPGLSTTKSTPDLKDTTTTAPRIPTRAPSHTAKRSHESLSLNHKKSMSKTTSLSHKSSSASINMPHKTSSSGLRSSLQMFSGLYQQDPSKIAQSQPRPPPPTPPQLKSSRPPPQGLPTRPNQQTPPMPPKPLQAPRSRSNSRAKSQNHIVDPRQLYEHPFGNELAQVSELAEEYSGGKVGLDEEEALMGQKGLCRFGAEEYMLEIHGLWGRAFGEGRVNKGRVEVGKEGGGGMVWI